MTTIVNNPVPTRESGGGMGMIIGGILVMVAAYVFIVYGLPAFRNMRVGTPQITIPSTIDINVNQPK